MIFGQTLTYIGRIRFFTKRDWLVYVAWIGLMAGLFAATFGFVLFGHANQAPLPAYVWNLPLGVFIFVFSIAVDTIGHRTVYKEELKKGESLVHGITIFCGISSCVLLSMAFDYPEVLYIPSLTMVILSIFYSVIDEALHWKRYFEKKSDSVEMVSHFGIFLGHFLFILTWWMWFEKGYPGVSETLQALKSL